MTEHDAINAARVLKDWCDGFNTGVMHVGNYIWDCAKCPFRTQDEDGDGDCRVRYPMDWKLEAQNK